MLKGLKNIFRKDHRVKQKNRQRFDSIISDERSNYLENIYKKLYEGDNTLTDSNILDSYLNFSDKIQTNTFAAAELEWVTISVICYYRPNLTEFLLRRGLLSIVWSLGNDIDQFTVLDFIEKRILASNIEPYGGIPPEVGVKWLSDILPTQKETIRKVLDDVIIENNIKLHKI